MTAIADGAADSAPMTVNTPMPPWYDWLADGGDAAEDAVIGIVELVTAGAVVSVELRDTTRTLDGLIWTWCVHVAAPHLEAAEAARG